MAILPNNSNLRDWTSFDPLLTALVMAAILVGGLMVYPVALLLSRGDSEKRRVLGAWVLVVCAWLMLVYVNLLLVLMWPVRYL